MNTTEKWVCWPDEQVAEVWLLLPGWQVAELERRASCCGLTTGQLLRLLVRDYLTGGQPGDVVDRSSGRGGGQGNEPGRSV
jgi:hypothetical protein